MNIDLGKKYDDKTPCCAPATSEPSKVYYPSLYLEGIADLKDLPESGELTVRYKRVSQTVSERDGKKRVSVELEVRQITGAKGGDSEKEKSGSSVLDELKDELE